MRLRLRRSLGRTTAINVIAAILLLTLMAGIYAMAQCAGPGLPAGSLQPAQTQHQEPA